MRKDAYIDHYFQPDFWLKLVRAGKHHMETKRISKMGLTEEQREKIVEAVKEAIGQWVRENTRGKS